MRPHEIIGVLVRRDRCNRRDADDGPSDIRLSTCPWRRVRSDLLLPPRLCRARRIDGEDVVSRGSGPQRQPQISDTPNNRSSTRPVKVQG